MISTCRCGSGTRISESGHQTGEMKMRTKLLPLAIAMAVFAIANNGDLAQAQPLLIDFNSLTQDGGPHPQDGYQSYDAGHEVPADFDTKEYTAFLTEVTVTPGWPDSPNEALTMQSIDRGAAHDAFWQGDKIDLLTDLLGVDTRVANGGNGDFTFEEGGEMTRLTLTLGGLPAGNYNWISYHHDTEWIHTQFFAEFSVNGGASFDVLTDTNGKNLFEMTNSNDTGGNPPADVHYQGDDESDPILLPSTLIWNFEKPTADDDLVIMFTPIAHTAVHTQWLGINGFELYQDVPPRPACDFDASGACDVADLDDLLNNLGSDDPLYDLEPDGIITLGDRDVWLSVAGEENIGVDYVPGDTGLNGIVNSSDLNDLALAWQSTDDPGWGNGDFNGDDVVSSSDLNDQGLNWQHGVAAASAATVPEPATGAMLLISLLGLAEMRRRS